MIFHLCDPASEDEISVTERRLAISLPHQIKLSYQHYNGFSVENPPLEILPLNALSYQADSKIHFATFNKSAKVCFDSNSLNQAGQWSILNCQDDYLITLTMASFWSNKVFAWIDKRRKIWTEIY